MIYGGDTACSGNIPDEPLTSKKFHEMMELVKEFPLKPFIAYSWVVPYDEVFKGGIVDKIIKSMHPEFNPKEQAGFLVSERWRRDIKEMENVLWKV